MGAKQKLLGAISSRTGSGIAVAAVSASISAVVTYKVASKRIEAVYAQKIDDELEATRKFFAAMQEKPTLEDLASGLGVKVKIEEAPEKESWFEPQTAPVEDPRPELDITGRGQATQYNKVVKQYTGNDDPNKAVTVDLPEETHNIFSPTDTLSQAEIDSRGSNSPYLITQGEFIEGEGSQDTLTYYAEDGVLADSQDMPIDNVDRMVGEVNLQRFGVGSGDKRVVYVRNEAIDQDWEIVLHDGSYAEIVAGFKDEPETPRRSRATQDE